MNQRWQRVVMAGRSKGTPPISTSVSAGAVRLAARPSLVGSRGHPCAPPEECCPSFADSRVARCPPGAHRFRSCLIPLAFPRGFAYGFQSSFVRGQRRVELFPLGRRPMNERLK